MSIVYLCHTGTGKTISLQEQQLYDVQQPISAQRIKHNRT